MSAPIEFLMIAGAPTPVAPFSHAVAAGGWVFVTGQMPTDPEEDGAPLPDGIEAQTRRVVDNLRIVLAGAGSALDRVVDSQSGETATLVRRELAGGPDDVGGRARPLEGAGLCGTAGAA